LAASKQDLHAANVDLSAIHQQQMDTFEAELDALTQQYQLFQTVAVAVCTKITALDHAKHKCATDLVSLQAVCTSHEKSNRVLVKVKDDNEKKIVQTKNELAELRDQCETQKVLCATSKSGYGEACAQLSAIASTTLELRVQESECQHCDTAIAGRKNQVRELDTAIANKNEELQVVLQHVQHDTTKLQGLGIRYQVQSDNSTTAIRILQLC